MGDGLKRAFKATKKSRKPKRDRTHEPMDVGFAVFNGHIQGDEEAMKLWTREYRPGWEPKV